MQNQCLHHVHVLFVCVHGNGMVVVDMTGKYDVIDVKIDKNALSTGSENLSELVTLAYKDAKTKADILIDKKMSEITGATSE